jgi:hypothetical protein
MTFSVVFAPERAQYCVERADGMRIWPTPFVYSDEDAHKRAVKLAEALNRMEAERAPAAEPTPDIPPDYCAACDLAVYAVQTPYSLRCPECGAQVAEGTAI